MPVDILQKVAVLAPKGKEEIKKLNGNNSSKNKDGTDALVKEYFDEVIKGSELFLTDYSAKEMIWLAGNGTQKRLFALYSREFSDFLISGFKSTYKEFVAASGFTEYIEECAVKARVNKCYLSVYNRIAFKDNRVYYNLNNSDNEVVRIDDS